jgi:sugar phosphate isomerase/epimerase
MRSENRRGFLRGAAWAGAGCLLATGTSAGIEPIRRVGRPRSRLSLAAYSYRSYLDLRQKPRPAMTLEGFIDAAADMPLDAVELTAYYFAETSPAYLARLKGRCTRLGLDVSGTAVGNNFCTGNASTLKEQIAHVKQWIERTSRLGGKTIRVFAGSVDRGDTEEQARRRCVAALEEVCEYAGRFGIFVALENHGGITGTPDQMLPLVRGVKSEWFGVNLDTGNFHTPDPYADLARLAPYAVVVQLKTEIQRRGKRKEPADLKRLLEILRAVNYRGYVALEYEAAEEPRKAVPRHLAELRKLMNE